MDFYNEYFNLINKKIKEVNSAILDKAVNLIRSINDKGGKIIIVGNGASATIASHVSLDLTKNAKIRAINFNEVGLLTCLSNDAGYERWVEKAIEFYADTKDLIILISSSGTSENIINGARMAKKRALKIITFSGFDVENPLKKLGDINFWVDSKAYNIIEMTHNIWLVSIIDRLIGSIEYSVSI